MAARPARQHHADQRPHARGSVRADDRGSFSSYHFERRYPLLRQRQLVPSRTVRQREIYFREAQEQIAPGSVSKDEVIDEAVAVALSDGQEKPEKLSLEPWLYRQALRALDELSRTDESNGNAVHLEDSARLPNVKGSDEPGLQFHQPDESITGATVIADSRVSTPEQILASDELLRLIASSLRDLGAGPREAFILHAVEGFSVDEIVVITGLPADRVLAFVSAARDHLRKAPGLAKQFRGRLAPTGAA